MKITEIKIIVEAIAWTRKYLMVDSDDRVLFFICIRGIIDRRLISSPNHIPNHEYAEIETKVLMKTTVRNKILHILVIKKKRGPLYSGYEPKSLD